MITGHLHGAASVGWDALSGSWACSLSFAIIDAIRGISGTQTIAEFLRIVQPRSTPTKTPTNFSSFDMTALPLSPFQRGKSVSMMDMSLPGIGFGLPTTFPAMTLNLRPDCRSMVIDLSRTSNPTQRHRSHSRPSRACPFGGEHPNACPHEVSPSLHQILCPTSYKRPEPGKVPVCRPSIRPHNSTLFS